MSAALKIFLSLITSNKGRKIIGIILCILISPLLVVSMFLSGLSGGALEHNKATINAVFNDLPISENAPQEFKNQVDEMIIAFQKVDNEIGEMTKKLEDGKTLNAQYIKSILFAEKFGDENFKVFTFDAREYIKQTVDLEERKIIIEDDPSTEEDESSVTTIEVAIPVDRKTLHDRSSSFLSVIIDSKEEEKILQVYTLLGNIIEGESGKLEGGGSADALVKSLLPESMKKEFVGGSYGSPFEDGWRDKVTSEFGRRDPITLPDGTVTSVGHSGMDLGAPHGTPVLAINDGGVVAVKHTSAGLGIYCIVDHGGGNISVYGHNSRILVSVGDRVVKGQVIAEVGKSGYATGNHLHLQLYLNGNLSNPRNVLE